jgi:flagellar biogenesis protein FliO
MQDKHPRPNLKPTFWQQTRSALLRLGRSWHTRPPRQLRVCENLALGEKRFLSVVEFGQRKFLVGGTGNSLAMLAMLSPPAEGQPKDPEAEADEEAPLWEFVNGGMIRCG